MDLETAAAVAEYRNNGEVFANAQDLLQVEGVTQKMISEMSGRICVASGYFSALCFAETESVRFVGIGVIERSGEGCRILRSSMDDKLWRTYTEEIEEAKKKNEEEQEDV